MSKKIFLGLVVTILFLLETVSAKTIYIDQPGEDLSNQYSYNYDYSNVVVELTYDEINSKFTGKIKATNLKPYVTYQVKFLGKPTCNYSGGNDLANEYIGLNGRWTCISCQGTDLQRNRDDAQYYARSYFRGNKLECIQGYLVFDFFTADNNGNVEKTIETSNSYHVLWCGGGICNSVNNNYLYKPDINHPNTFYCPPNKVDGQIERKTCNGITLSNGKYDVIIALTEESFHNGTWATVLEKNMMFEIAGITTTTTVRTTTSWTYRTITTFPRPTFQVMPTFPTFSTPKIPSTPSMSTTPSFPRPTFPTMPTIQLFPRPTFPTMPTFPTITIPKLPV